MARSRRTSVLVRYLCWSSTFRSIAPMMITLTMLAESKCDDPLSEQVIPASGSSTQTATRDDRPFSAARMSCASLAASLGLEVEVQTTAAAAEAAAAGRATDELEVLGP